jgi:hypothetical protein
VRDDQDEDLRQRFQELKARDRTRAPAFDAVLQSARASGARQRRYQPLRAAAAVLIVIAGAAAAVLLLHQGSPKPELVAIGSWRSPTGSLLQMPGAALLDSVPGITTSVIQLGDPAGAGHQTPRHSGHTRGDTI